MNEEMSFFLSVGLGVILGVGLFSMRHLLGFLLLLEMTVLLSLVVLSEFCPFGWQYLSALILVMGVAEGGLGLSIMVKVSRAQGEDRFYLGNLVAG